MVQYRWQASKCPVYEWTDGGRRLYQAEWRTLQAHPEGRATVKAGYDAIHRCADATWFCPKRVGSFGSYTDFLKKRKR